ncbi:neuroblast differentiation-associated protein AHNAK [Lates japonicus]|uniref:Neuroblast differentiation-associated protein AHNAK n=1 Tax=Lates japonicus TaxID=270547 RepID=A0AAD3NDB7_LATJO|nr:neuroblast differentiation-associated protein AHNAK [Lates japonicus]
MAAEDHSLAPVPSPAFPSLCKPGALPSSVSNHSAQPRGAATQKKRNCEVVTGRSAFLGLGRKGRGHVFKDAQAGVRLLGRKDCAKKSRNKKHSVRLKPLALLEQSKENGDWEGPDKTGLTIEQTSGGEIFVREVKGESPAARSGKVYEGDQIVGATIYFDNMSSEETAELLKTLNRHKVGLKLQNKGDKSPYCSPVSTPCRSPMGTLTWEEKTRFGGSSPDILRGDDGDYERIYTKIKPRLKSEDLAES